MTQKLLIVSAATLLTLALAGCSSMGSASTAASAYQMLGGSQTVSNLSSGFLGSVLKDPQLASLTSGKNINSSAVSSKMSDQLCSMLGGGCTAPLTDAQINTAASKLSPAQSQAISNNFTSALHSVTSNPEVQNLVTKAVGPKIGGIVTALL